MNRPYKLAAQLSKLDLTPRMFAIFLAMLSSASAHSYELIDLGANVNPQDISDSGTVVGAKNTDLFPNIAFRWTASDGFQELNGTIANAINFNPLSNQEVIVGNTQTGAFLYDGQTSIYLGDYYSAYAINSTGKAAGSKSKDNPYRTNPRPTDPAIYDTNTNKWDVLDIAKVYPRGTRQGVYADLFQLWDINDAGYAVGKKSRYGLVGSSAILTTPAFDSVSYISLPNGGYASAINNNNFIVGTTATNVSLGEYAFAFLYDYNNDILLNLGTLPSNGPGSEPGLTSSASDINDSEQIVGSSWLVTSLTSLYEPEKYHAFLWENGEMQDLNDLVVLQGGWTTLTQANAINENGDIVGIGYKNGVPHGFLLTTGEVPSPNENLPPIAVISADPISGKAPLTVNFSGEGSSDPEGSMLSFQWKFGDESPSDENSLVQHVYDNPGTYLAKLTVTDSQGLTNTAEVEIVVRKGKGKK